MFLRSQKGAHGSVANIECGRPYIVIVRVRVNAVDKASDSLTYSPDEASRLKMLQYNISRFRRGAFGGTCQCSRRPSQSPVLPLMPGSWRSRRGLDRSLAPRSRIPVQCESRRCPPQIAGRRREAGLVPLPIASVTSAEFRGCLGTASDRSCVRQCGPQVPRCSNRNRPREIPIVAGVCIVA